MKAKKGFNLRDVCGEKIIVAEGKENIDFSNIISMNESSTNRLWLIPQRSCSNGCRLESLRSRSGVFAACACKIACKTKKSRRIFGATKIIL